MGSTTNTTRPTRRRRAAGYYAIDSVTIVRTGGYTHETRAGHPTIGAIWQVRSPQGEPVADCRTLAAATVAAYRWIDLYGKAEETIPAGADAS